LAVRLSREAITTFRTPATLKEKLEESIARFRKSAAASQSRGLLRKPFGGNSSWIMGCQGVLAPPWYQKGLHCPLAAEKEAIPSTSSFGLLDGVQRCHQVEV